MSKHAQKQLAILSIVCWLTAMSSFLGRPLPSVNASDGITVIENKASPRFAQRITFTLRARSDAEIQHVYLFFRAAGDEKAEPLSIDIEPSSTITAEHVHELRYSPLPPFTTVTFWWRIEDSLGRKHETIRQQFTYMDDRFEWENIEEKYVDDNGTTHRIVAHWIKDYGDPIFGQAALDVARASLREINAELHAEVPETIKIYIYDTQQNLNVAMELTGREWVVGQAHPELGAIVVSIPSDHLTGYKGLMERYIPHEITHLLIYRRVKPSNYRYVPEWLDEGLATANERLPTTQHLAAIENAREQGTLIPLEELCNPFPPDHQLAILSYAQSGSVVKFIRQQYGAEGIRKLLTAYADGASCNVGVQKALDINLSGLETAWRASLEPQAPWQALLDQVGVWIGLWILSVLVALPMMGKLRRHR